MLFSSGLYLVFTGSHRCLLSIRNHNNFPPAKQTFVFPESEPTQVFYQCRQTSVKSLKRGSLWPHTTLAGDIHVLAWTSRASSVHSGYIHPDWSCVIQAFYCSVWIELTEWLAGHLTWLPVFITLLDGWISWLASWLNNDRTHCLPASLAC